MKLSKTHSGYSPGEQQWKDFCRAWQEDACYAPCQGFADFLTISSGPDAGNTTQDSTTDCGLELPLSYLEFYEAYTSLGGVFSQEGVNDGIGMFEQSSIITFRDYNPTYYELLMDPVCNMSDAVYYQFGTEQECRYARTDNYVDALVIGRYSFDSHELMLLYPNNKTVDGECEVAILGQAWEFRTPSFAEMMRQLSNYCLLDVEDSPPYSQQSLKNTVADFIKLENVWWT